MIGILHTFVLSLHLICVHIAATGPLVCVWLEWKARRGDEAARRAGRYLANLSLQLLLAGSLLGIVLGALVWSDEFTNALKRLGPRIHSGVWELLFSLVLMIIHPLWWRASPKPKWTAWSIRVLLPLLAGSNLLYHFPLLFFVLGDVAANPLDQQFGSAETGVLTGEMFRERMTDGAVMAPVLHFWISSLAVTGAALLWCARKWIAQQNDDGGLKNPDIEHAIQRVSQWGGRIALTAAILQIPIGIWVLTQTPPTRQAQLMGGDLLASLLLVLGLAAALGMMHQMSAIVLRGGSAASLMRGIALTATTVLLMTGASQRAKTSLQSNPKLRTMAFQGRRARVSDGLGRPSFGPGPSAPTSSVEKESRGPTSSAYAHRLRHWLPSVDFGGIRF